MKNTKVPREAADAFLEKYGSAPAGGGISLFELLKRPEISYDKLAEVDPDRPELLSHVRTSVEVEIKYEGYIAMQERRIERFRKLENRRIPEDIDYDAITNLRIEARQKLAERRPESVGQASRISGVSPADINVLLIWLEKMKRSRKQEAANGTGSQK